MDRCRSDQQPVKVTETKMNAFNSGKENAEKLSYEERKIKIRILALALLGFLISVKSDRYFPLPDQLPEPIFQIILLPYTCLFFAAFIIFIKPGIVGDAHLSLVNRISVVKLTTVIILIFEAMAFILLIVQDIRYALFGYHLNIPVAIFLFACIGASLIYLLIKDASQGLLVLIALAAYTGTYLLSIVSFPLHSQRSDMLPLILSGCQSFLAGMSPYAYHDLLYHPPHQVFTYLPGMWMAYLPAAASGVDLRFINLISMLVSALILAYSANGSRNHSMLLVPVFLLTPYLQYRHEIYLGVLFLILSIVFFLDRNNKWWTSSIASGYALAAYQFVWVIFPFIVVSAFKRWGIKKAFVNSLIAVAIALILILPFLLGSPEEFIAGVYGNWFYIDTPSVNLSYLISLFIPWDSMIIVQGIVMVAIFSLALQRMDPEDRWGWMATALVLFIAMNRVINVYFYLIILLLLVMHGISVSTLKEKPDEEEEAPN